MKQKNFNLKAIQFVVGPNDVDNNSWVYSKLKFEYNSDIKIKRACMTNSQVN